jgi:hypothetical protein
MNDKKKLVKRDYFNAMLSYVEATDFSTENITNAEMVAFITKELELLAKKNVANRKPTEADLAKDTLRTKIFDVLSASAEPMTIADLIKADAEFAKFTPQKMTGLINPMVDNIVERIKVKGRSYYKVKA